MESLGTEYLIGTLEILQRLGSEGIAELDEALGTYRARSVHRTAAAGYEGSDDIEQKNAAALIDVAVAEYEKKVRRPVGGHGYLGDLPELTEVGHSTIAESILEASRSRHGIRLLALGRLSIARSVRAHQQRSEARATKQDQAALREAGITGTPTVHVDEETGLHLVGLVTTDHCVYEGTSLRHSLSDRRKSESLLAAGMTQLYGLRQNGTEPRLTLQVHPQSAVVVQARRYKNQALVRDSVEHSALMRSLEPLATHVAIEAGLNNRGLAIVDAIVPWQPDVTRPRL